MESAIACCASRAAAPYATCCAPMTASSSDGQLFGVYGRNAQVAMSAAPLELKLTTDNPFRGVDFFETDEGGLVVSG